MEHGQKFNVAFTSSISRKLLVDKDAQGQALAAPFMDKYYRNNFTVEGKEFSARYPEDIAGKVGTVMFVKKGSAVPGSTSGQLVAEDAFTITGVSNAEILMTAATGLKAWKEVLANADFK